MKIFLELRINPEHLESLETDLRRYVEPKIFIDGDNKAFVEFESTDIADAQCGVIICDKYAFGGEDSG